jgi:hypothetical protein
LREEIDSLRTGFPSKRVSGGSLREKFGSFRIKIESMGREIDYKNTNETKI